MSPHVDKSALRLLLPCLAFTLPLALPGVASAGGLVTPTETVVPKTTRGPIRQKLHDWDVIVGSGVMYKPKYEGADEYEFQAVPFVSLQFFDFLNVDPTGAGVTAYENGPFHFDFSAHYKSGRDEDDSKALRGMGDIDWGVGIGGRATMDVGPVGLFLSVEQIVGGGEGLLASAGISVQRPVSERVILGAEAGATFADDKYMESYFGVDRKQSANSGYAEYKPEAGIKSVDAAVSATWLINEKWLLRGEQKFSVLTGDAADSPIVQEEFQSKTMLLLGYRF
ncbi:MipA/OmpV family protein [Methyloligella sp. 2.7D]|uniref:MipA/OmpV family protein n=1 Tax=unclassified Methyloligella TaxID=2625955 RepID=UPI00157CED51|nr:MipA/OmpV family protein [Methyloligella sp. GL2]QKP76649.1 MipA/OmpV family protein [Methyloligella sp. GL2]